MHELPEIVISSSHAAALVSFSKSLGISPSECLSEALDDWLSIVAPARIEEVSHNEKLTNVLAFGAIRKAG